VPIIVVEIGFHLDAMLPTIAGIARCAGLARTTASKALSGGIRGDRSPTRAPLVGASVDTRERSDAERNDRNG
jgi:hypothetical protein